MTKAPTAPTPTREFLVYVAITLAESHYSWFMVKKYRRYVPKLGGEIEPGPGDTANVSGVLYAESPYGSGWLRHDLTLTEVAALGVARILTGQTGGSVSADYGDQIDAAVTDNDAGAIDADLADMIFQVGVFGEVVYS